MGKGRTGRGRIRGIAVLLWFVSLAAHAGDARTIHQAVLGEIDPRTPEVSTEELRRILAEGTATVLGGEKGAPLVLYCNGPFCGKSKRLAEELLAAGFSSVRRYQLGIPVWRDLGGVCEIELAGLRHVLAHDGTAVVIDAREAADYRRGTLPGARNIPRSLVLEAKDVGEVRRAKDDGRLPMEDHNTRLIVLGADAGSARHVAEAISREAFHNVAYFPGTLDEARAAAPDR